MPHHHELIMSEETATSPQIKIPWLIGTVAAFSIFAFVAFYSKRMTNDFPGSQRGEERAADLAKLRDDANKTLTTADWVDQDKGTIRIPIDEAMSKEVDTLKAKAPAIGAEIPGSKPATPAAPAAAPAPAPASTNSAAAAKPKP
jgi:hypothetical protein